MKLYCQPPAEMEVILKKEVPPMRNPEIIPKSDIPVEAIEALANCLLPDILEYFNSKEGRQEFEKWKQEHSKENED